ncbi:MAG: GHMP kinase [Chloroflexi bacterium]|nr:GHMP kinase [Chloroflexota bacterium]
MLIETSLRLDSAPNRFQVPIGLELESVAHGGGFYAYCAGVVAYMRERFRVGGLHIHTTAMDLPIRKGLSSSAAICVLTARALNRVYGLGLSTREEMECAYQGEILAGSRCGRMDQACAFGRTPTLLRFDGDEMEVQTLTLSAPLYLVIVDLMRGKNTRKILQSLNAAFTDDCSAVGARVRDALGRQNALLVERARVALEASDSPALGALMHEAQAVFDGWVAPACPDELAAPKLHGVLDHSFVRARSWGGKGVGSQGDGCAQLVAHSAKAQRELIQELPRLLDVQCLELTLHPGAGAEA